jgi:hypothetical protein
MYYEEFLPKIRAALTEGAVASTWERRTQSASHGRTSSRISSI